jgi:hypothetical protein
MQKKDFILSVCGSPDWSIGALDYSVREQSTLENLLLKFTGPPTVTSLVVHLTACNGYLWQARTGQRLADVAPGSLVHRIGPLPVS